MRTWVILGLLSFHISCLSQTPLADSFRIGNFLEIFHDSLKVYFNCTGTVVDSRCASFYRVGKIDSSIINVTGLFQDYYASGHLYLKATMLNNSLEGVASYYYPNGTLKEEGAYLHNIRDGKWTYYYQNGKIEKVFDYIRGEPLVLEAFDSRGNPTVSLGNGEITTKIRTYKQCDYFEVSGAILNGKRSGKWTMKNPGALSPFGTETFANGDFVQENQPYDNARIVLTVYTPNENVNLMENSLGCPGTSFFFWKYKDDDLYKSFYAELEAKLNHFASVLKNQWVVVGITVTKRNKLSQIKVASSINDTLFENYIYNSLSKMTDWTTAKVNSSRVESNIYFSILVSDGQILIPVDYVMKNN